MDRLRVLEIIGGCASVVFFLFGVNMMLHISLDHSAVSLMNHLATALFLVFFGLAAAVILLARGLVPALCEYFGFLTTWTGRGIYFLLMGMYLFPAMCTKNYGNKCFTKADSVLDQLGIIAAFISFFLGIVILILRCTKLSESYNLSVSGTARGGNPVDIAAAVASAGMCLLAVKMMLDCINGGEQPLRELSFALSATFIIAVFGIASLVSSLSVNVYVATMFGFLDRGVPRGIFYVLMGFFTFGIFYRGNSDVFTWICYLCSIISTIVGVVIIVKLAL